MSVTLLHRYYPSVYGAHVSRRSASLSGGNQQRVVSRASSTSNRVFSSPPSRPAVSTSAGSVFIHQQYPRLPRSRRRRCCSSPKSSTSCWRSPDRIVVLYGGQIGCRSLRWKRQRPTGSAISCSVPPHDRRDRRRAVADAAGGQDRQHRSRCFPSSSPSSSAPSCCSRRPQPARIYRLLAIESFGGDRRIAATLSAATPIILTGLATAVAFGRRLQRRGRRLLLSRRDGRRLLGFAYVGLSGVLIIAAGAGRGRWSARCGCWYPGLLKARLGVDEVVTTLMLNFVAISLTAYLVNGPLLAPGSANSATRRSSRRPSCPGCCRPRPSTSAS